MPQNANLSELTDAAADKMSNFKERSATGIQYMIEKHTRLEVDISVMPNYVIIPHGGTYLEWVWNLPYMKNSVLAYKNNNNNKSYFYT